MDIIAMLSLSQRDKTHPAQGCTIETCPVSLSVYGYRPAKPLSLIFAGLFAISFVSHIMQGFNRKSWSFLVALGIGTLMEATGYVGRLMMYKDPFKRGPLAIQIISLTVAPAFMAAGIYLTLKHLVIILGPKKSRFAPQWYTRIFITCDIISIAVQTGGTSISTKDNLVNIANGIMEAGIVSQVVTLLIFGGLALDFYMSYRKDPSSAPTSLQIQNPTFRQQHNNITHVTIIDGRFKRAVIAVVIAYTAILIRCIYRIAEMAGGWRNKIMQNQPAFVVLDGIMCVTAVFVLNFCHPGDIFEKSKCVQANGDGGVEETGSGQIEMVAPVQIMAVVEKL